MFGATAFDGILRAAQAGADWAWRDLYEDIAPRIASYARASRVPDPEAVVGDVFLGAVQSLGTFEGDRRAFHTWMFTLARHAVIDEHRKSMRRRTAPLPPEVLAELGPPGDAEQESLRALAEERVRDALAPLTSEQRDVLLLRIVAGLTIDETARVLRKSQGAVKGLQARALASLERRLSPGAVTL